MDLNSRSSDLDSVRAMVSDAAAYVSERAISLVLTAVAGIVVARYLGPSDLGLLQYATTVFGLLAPVALLGMPTILVREFSTRTDDEAVLASALSVQVPAAVGASVAGAGVVLLTRGFESEIILIVAALAPLPLLGLQISFRSYLEAKGRSRRVAGSGLAGAVIGSASKVSAAFASAPIWVFALLSSLGSAVTAIGHAFGVGFGTLRRLLRPRRLARPELRRRLLRESWPLLMAGMAVMLYMKADIVMLGLMAGDAETGIYSAAARLSEVWYFIPVAAAAAVRPRLARLFAGEEMTAYGRLTQRFLTVSFATAATAAVVTWFAADFAVNLIYGEAFAGSSDILRVHIFAAPFVFLGVAGSQWFIDHGLTRAAMYRSIAGAGINLLMNLLLIPTMGALGAAVSTLVAYALSGVIINSLSSRTRPLFLRQIGAMRLRWQ